MAAAAPRARCNHGFVRHDVSDPVGAPRCSRRAHAQTGDEGKSGGAYRHDGLPCAQYFKFTPARATCMTRSAEPCSELIPPPPSVMAPSAAAVPNLANRYSSRTVRAFVGQGVFPSGSRGPASEKFRGGGNAGARRRRGVGIALGVVRLGEGNAAGDVGEIAIRGDAEARPNGRQIIGLQRLPDYERHAGDRQHVGVVEKGRVAAERVEIRFQPDDERSALQVAANLTATDEARYVGRAGAVIRHFGGICGYQMGSGIDRGCKARSAAAAAAVEPHIASRPPICGQRY